MAGKSNIWMPLYIGDYLADTMHLNARQHGAYLLLLMYAWRNGGRIPGAPEAMAAIAKLHIKEWRQDEQTLLSFFYVEPDGDGYGHKRVKAELGVSEARSKAGSRGAAKRWQTDSEGDGKPIANEWQSDGNHKSQSQSQSQSQEESEEEREAFEEFVTAARRYEWTVPSGLTDTRRKHLRTRLKEHGLAGWKAAIARAAQSTFIQTKMDGWSFDWLVKASNFAKVFEGNYDDKSRPIPDENDPWAGVQI